MRIVVINHVALDGVMQGPGRADEDTRDGFTYGGWAEPNTDDVMGRAWGERLSEALTNTTKCAAASHARVAVEQRDSVLRRSRGDRGPPVTSSSMLALRVSLDGEGRPAVGPVGIDVDGPGRVAALDRPERVARLIGVQPPSRVLGE
jgi:hypothetical protein